MTGKEKLNDLMTEFDEMGYAPTTLCSDPEDTVRDWKVNLMSAIGQIEQEGRKQAVEETLNDIKETYDFYGDDSMYSGYEVKRFLVYIAQKYGVEIG